MWKKVWRWFHPLPHPHVFLSAYAAVWVVALAFLAFKVWWPVWAPIPLVVLAALVVVTAAVGVRTPKKFYTDSAVAKEIADGTVVLDKPNTRTIRLALKCVVPSDKYDVALAHCERLADAINESVAAFVTDQRERPATAATDQPAVRAIVLQTVITVPADRYDEIWTDDVIQAINAACRHLGDVSTSRQADKTRR